MDNLDIGSVFMQDLERLSITIQPDDTLTALIVDID